MGAFRVWIGPLAWAWLIIIGAAIIITPGGPICPACTLNVNMAIGIIAVVLGAAAFVGQFAGRSGG